MEYVEFKENFCENMIKFLPEKYRVLSISIKETKDGFSKKVIEQAVIKYQDTELCTINLTNFFEIEKEKIEQVGIVSYLTELSDSFKDSLDLSLKKQNIHLPEADPIYNHEVYSKEGKIYDIRCTKVKDTLSNIGILENISELESSDLYIVPYDGQLVVISEREIKESEIDFPIMLEELEKSLLTDIDHFGSNVLKYNKDTKSIVQV